MTGPSPPLPPGVGRRLLLYVAILAVILYAASFLPWQRLAGPWSGF